MSNSLVVFPYGIAVECMELWKKGLMFRDLPTICIQNYELVAIPTLFHCLPVG